MPFELKAIGRFFFFLEIALGLLIVTHVLQDASLAGLMCFYVLTSPHELMTIIMFIFDREELNRLTQEQLNIDCKEALAWSIIHLTIAGLAIAEFFYQNTGN